MNARGLGGEPPDIMHKNDDDEISFIVYFNINFLNQTTLQNNRLKHYIHMYVQDISMCLTKMQ